MLIYIFIICLVWCVPQISELTDFAIASTALSSIGIAWELVKLMLVFFNVCSDN